MGLTAAGAALFAFGLLLLFSPGSRIRLVIAGILGVSIPMFAAMAAGLVSIGSSIAPVFNNLGGIG
jgi:hypothetical protein